MLCQCVMQNQKIARTSAFVEGVNLSRHMFYACIHICMKMIFSEDGGPVAFVLMRFDIDFFIYLSYCLTFSGCLMHDKNVSYVINMFR